MGFKVYSDIKGIKLRIGATKYILPLVVFESAGMYGFNGDVWGRVKMVEIPGNFTRLNDNTYRHLLYTKSEINKFNKLIEDSENFEGYYIDRKRRFQTALEYKIMLKHALVGAKTIEELIAKDNLQLEFVNAKTNKSVCITTTKELVSYLKNEYIKGDTFTQISMNGVRPKEKP